MRERDDRRRKEKNNEIDIISLELEEPIQSRRKRSKSLKRQAEEEAKQRKIANREFVGVTYLFVCIFLMMMGYIVYFQTVQSKNIINSAYNVRLDSMTDRVVRGQILDKNGNVLAKSKENGYNKSGIV